MEQVFSSSLILLITFLFSVFMLLKKGQRSKSIENSLYLPPGPWKLPMLGNLHQLLGFLPHQGLRDLAKKYGPLMHLQIGEIPTIVVSSKEFAEQVLKTHDVIFASRVQTLAAKITTYDSSGMVFSAYGDKWRQLRKICVMELFSTKRVQSFQSVREEEVSNLINWIASKSGSVINLTDKVFSLVSCITSQAAFGNKCKDQEEFISVMEELLKVIGGFDVADLFPSIKFLQSITGMKSRVLKMHQQIDKIISNIIDERKKRKAKLKSDESEEDEDLLDVFLRLQEHGSLALPITTDNIKAVIFEIFAGGSDTSATTIDWAMSEMMKNPRVLEKAQAEVRQVFNTNGKIDEMGVNELQFLKLVIKETLRLHPPAPLLFPRECGKRCEISGFDIPSKARVIINAWAIARDSEYWTEPESFIPERFLDCSVDYKGTYFEYIPFGAGRRICPGITFAFAVMEFSVAMLLYHFDWKLPGRMKHDELDMTEGFGATVRRKDDLCVIPIPYQYPSPIA